MNMKLNIALCDDEENALRITSSSVKAIFDNRDVKTNIVEFSDCKSLESYMAKTALDLIFLDIEMPKCDGVDFAVKLRERGDKTDIIFVTNSEERVFETFKVHPFSFIRKSHFLSDINHVVNNYVTSKEKAIGTCKPLVVSLNNQVYNLNTADIEYIECIQRMQKIHFLNGRAPLTIGSTMDVLADKLQEYGFYRVHKGYIVNLREVSLISVEGVVMSSKMCIPINRKKVQQFKHDFLMFQQNNGAALLVKN